MPAGESRCENCGTTRGEQHKCPFCRVIAEAEPDPVLRFRCPACGGPRIPHATPPAAAGEALVHLKAARSVRSSQLAWKAASVSAAIFGVISLLIMIGVFSIMSPPLIPTLAGYVLCAIPFVFAAVGWRKGGARMAEVSRALDEAWLYAAKDLVKRKGIMRAGDLADAMRIAPEQAEHIMVRLASADELRSDVTESGDLAVSMRSPRVRIAEGETPLDQSREPGAQSVEQSREPGAQSVEQSRERERAGRQDEEQSRERERAGSPMAVEQEQPQDGGNKGKAGA
jgi:hypothetical protein